MADRLRFPLYVLRASGRSTAVLAECDGEKHLPLFTSAENAHLYRHSEALHVQITRLSEPSELREVLLAHREEAADFKIVLDPVCMHAR